MIKKIPGKGLPGYIDRALYSINHGGARIRRAECTCESRGEIAIISLNVAKAITANSNYALAA